MTFLTPVACYWQQGDNGSGKTSPDEQFYFFQLTADNLAQ